MEFSLVPSARFMIFPESVSIAFDFFSIAAEFCSVLDDLGIVRAVFQVPAEFVSVSFKLCEIAARLPAIPPNRFIALLQFFVILPELG